MAPAEKNKTVMIPVPLVDRDRGIQQSIMGLVFHRNSNEMYRIGVKAGLGRCADITQEISSMCARFMSESDLNLKDPKHIRDY